MVPKPASAVEHPPLRYAQHHGSPLARSDDRAEYLAREPLSDVKHEYVFGEAFAMAGGTPAHAIVSANLARSLGNALVGKGCVVASSDLRVHVPATRLYTYPDVTVVCGVIETAPRDPNSITNLTVLFEVLSDATEAHDRGAKFKHYERIAALRAYVLVTQDARRVEQFTRTDAGWLRTVDDLDDGAIEIALPSLEITLTLTDLTSGLELLPPA